MWYGASQCGAESNTLNLIVEVILYLFLHTMGLWHHKTIHNTQIIKNTMTLVAELLAPPAKWF
jgi:hypothetical protein